MVRLVRDFIQPGLISFLFCLALATNGYGQAISVSSSTVKVVTTAVWDGATADDIAAGAVQEGVPTDLVQLDDGTERFLLSTLGGTLHVLNADAQLITDVSNPLLNREQVGATLGFNLRFGFTAIAVHPNFSDSSADFGFGKIYGLVAQPADTAEPDFTPTDIPANNHQSVLFEYDLSEIVGDADQLSVGAGFARRELLRIQQDGPSHNVFDLAFNEFGDLYISVGDGTANNLLQTSYRLQYAQNLNEVYGKVLRISPDPSGYLSEGGTMGSGRVSDNGSYSIPESNPFFGQSGALDEIYANGVRSPFRMSIDPNDPTVLWLGDVGEGNREEVNRITSGGNYGWGLFEGTANAPDPTNSNPVVQGTPEVSFPVFEYSHSNIPSNSGVAGGGVSVIGGVIYRGQALGPEFQGIYIGAELGNFFGSGSISRLIIGDPSLSDSTQAPAALRISSGSSTFDNTQLGIQNLPNLIVSVTDDLAGEVYILGLAGSNLPGIDEGDGLTGQLVVAKVIPVEPVDSDGVVVDYRYGVDSLGNGDLFSDPNGVFAPAGFAVNGETIGSTNFEGRTLAFNGNSPEPDVASASIEEITSLPGVRIDGFTIYRTRYSTGNNAYGFVEGGEGRLEPAQPFDGEAFANSFEVVLVSDSYLIEGQQGDAVRFSFLAGSDSGDLLSSYRTFLIYDGQDIEEIGESVEVFGAESDRIERDFISTRDFQELALMVVMNAGPGERSLVDQLFLQVQIDFLVGDLNGDGITDLLDISPFVEALTSGSFILEADINQDGAVDLFDVAPFVELLTGG